jgi:hypothetical protein
MLLNDVHNEQQRLAYLLGGSMERHVGGGRWTPLMGAIVGVSALVFVFLWVITDLLWR